MAVKGEARDFYKKFKFVVEIDGFAYAGFQKCSKLEAIIAVAEQSEGGSIIPNKSASRVKFTDITLDRGATDDLDMFNWFKTVVDAAANSGGAPASYKRNLDIVQQARDGTTKRRWRLTGAFPTMFSPGEWDNDSDDNAIESAKLTFDLFDLVKP